jgi:hypothetical protein
VVRPRRRPRLKTRRTKLMAFRTKLKRLVGRPPARPWRLRGKALLPYAPGQGRRPAVRVPTAMEHPLNTAGAHGARHPPGPPPRFAATGSPLSCLSRVSTRGSPRRCSATPIPGSRCGPTSTSSTGWQIRRPRRWNGRSADNALPVLLPVEGPRVAPGALSCGVTCGFGGARGRD